MLILVFIFDNRNNPFIDEMSTPEQQHGVNITAPPADLSSMLIGLVILCLDDQMMKELITDLVSFLNFFSLSNQFKDGGTVLTNLWLFIVFSFNFYTIKAVCVSPCAIVYLLATVSWKPTMLSSFYFLPHTEILCLATTAGRINRHCVRKPISSSSLQPGSLFQDTSHNITEASRQVSSTSTSEDTPSNPFAVFIAAEESIQNPFRLSWEPSSNW